MRNISEQIFGQFWFGDADNGSRSRPRVYSAQLFGSPGKRLQVIILDTRFFRSPLKRGQKRIGGSWTPDNDSTKRMLGNAQWKWLEEQLGKPADVRIIASSIQFAAEDARQEAWAILPQERQRMLDLLTTTQANGLIFIRGDRHWSELSAIANRSPYPIYDFTSSSFNQLHQRGTPTNNRHRFLPKTYHKEKMHGNRSRPTASAPPQHG